jgi:molybdopterin-binding protein
MITNSEILPYNARMSFYKVGQAAELLGVSPDVVRRWIDEGALPAVRSPGGHREIEGADLARYVKSIADPSAVPTVVLTSARNRFVGLVTDVISDTVMAQVEIVAGPHRIVSLMSAEAVRSLGLEPGKLAVATIKATNVVVEVTKEGEAR